MHNDNTYACTFIRLWLHLTFCLMQHEKIRWCCALLPPNQVDVCGYEASQFTCHETVTSSLIDDYFIIVIIVVQPPWWVTWSAKSSSFLLVRWMLISEHHLIRSRVASCVCIRMYVWLETQHAAFGAGDVIL